MWRVALTKLNNTTSQFFTSDDLNVPKVGTEGGQLEVILRLVYLGIGALSVIFLIISGYQYLISTGDPQKTAKAKDSIIYALIGLVISVFAAAIVNFVLIRLS